MSNFCGFVDLVDIWLTDFVLIITSIFLTVFTMTHAGMVPVGMLVFINDKIKLFISIVTMSQYRSTKVVWMRVYFSNKRTATGNRHQARLLFTTS